MPSWSRSSSANNGPVVLSLMVQATMPESTKARKPFSTLVHHLLQRLLHSESLGLGEEASTRVSTLAYAVALPGMLYALYLFPLYHQPLAKPTFWFQAGDHLFFVMYGFAVVGIGAVLQWDSLFPDPIDTLILTNLPVKQSKLLLARVLALGLLFGAVLLGANSLGILFLPAVADLPGLFFRQLTAQAAAVLLGSAFVMFSLIALQGVLVCVLGQAIIRKISPLIQTIAVLVLLTMLFLFPLIHQDLKRIFASFHTALFWFPPFWFLGVYERLLHGAAVGTHFPALAQLAIWMTLASAVLAVATYPLAYARRVRQTVEGYSLSRARTRMGLGGELLRALREGPRRAAFCWIGQTLWRTQSTRLLLAVFGGFAAAFATASMVGDTSHAGLGLRSSRAWTAIAIVAFLSVAGLRVALRAAVGKAGGWAFRVVCGRPKRLELEGAELWVGLYASVATCGVGALLALLLPGRGVYLPSMQIAFGFGLVVLLTDVFFLNERSIPFTEEVPYTVNELSYFVLIYFVCFPAVCLAAATWGPWIEIRAMHALAGALILAFLHVALRLHKEHELRRELRLLDIEDDDTLLPGEMGLRN